MPGLFFYNYQHCNHSSLLRGKTYEGIKNGDLDLFASIHFLLRGKTFSSRLAKEPIGCFNPLPSCEGRRIRPLGTEAGEELQSTSLLRGKTRGQNRKPRSSSASIHFPLAREDENYPTKNRHYITLQSTSLLRGKTRHILRLCRRPGCFNPLPSCEGRHLLAWGQYMELCFNPLPSCEGRRVRCGLWPCRPNASIHFPLAREDSERRVLHDRSRASIHFPLAREDVGGFGSLPL